MPRLVLLVAASLGLAVVARAAAMYRGTDSLAFALVLVIGAGLLIGLGELWQRALRADRLGRHLRTLPRPASLEAVEVAPEPLRAMLLARTAGTHFSAQGASLATYLLGMLVMLGMLGTFLGLFESLRGAREALTTTGGDVDALRAGLASPMTGLSRAFGTSATGISASALLGLSLVFTRREEARFSRELSAYVAGPLQPLTVQGRMLLALETVAASTHALPETGAAMQAALSQVEKLEAQIASERKENAERLLDLTRSLVAEVRSSFATLNAETRASLEASGQTTAAAVESFSEKTASLLRETSREQLEASRKANESTSAALRSLTEETAKALRASIEQASSALREAGAETASSMRQAGTEASTALRELGREASLSLRELADQSSESLRMASESASSALREVGSEATLALRESGREQLEASRLAMEQASSALLEASRSSKEAMEQASAEIGASLARAADEASRSAQDASEAVRNELGAALAQAAEGAIAAIGPIAEQATSRAGEVALTHLSRWLERMERDADARQQREEALSSRLSSIVDSVAGGVAKLAEETRAQSTELQALAEEVRARTAQVGAASEARIAEVAEQAKVALELQVSAIGELEARLENARAELGGALVAKIEEHASSLTETTTSTAALAKEAAELLRVGSAEISAAAELLTSAIDRHREASEKWLDGIALVGSEQAAHPASTEPIADSQDLTREALEHVIELQREMITEVRSLRPAEAEAAEG